jgi:hypothetical protein
MAVFFANLMFAFVRKAPAPANQGRRFAFGRATTPLGLMRYAAAS